MLFVASNYERVSFTKQNGKPVLQWHNPRIMSEVAGILKLRMVYYDARPLSVWQSAVQKPKNHLTQGFLLPQIMSCLLGHLSLSLPWATNLTLFHCFSFSAHQSQSFVFVSHISTITMGPCAFDQFSFSPAVRAITDLYCMCFRRTYSRRKTVVNLGFNSHGQKPPETQFWFYDMSKLPI